MTTVFAKSLRRNASDAEKRLWRRLRDRQFCGFKFRRQVALGTYVVDFLCFDARLVLEIDGGQHDTNRDYDERRSAWLNSQGFKVVRFWNHEVLAQTDAVLEVIRRELLARTPHPGPLPQGERGRQGDCPSPSPLMGEGDPSTPHASRLTPHRARGFALATALVFLLVITLLGVSLFLGVNLQQKAAGNSLEKTRALELANSATIVAERWLATLSVPLDHLTSCSSNSVDFRICTVQPTTPNQPRTWRNAGATPIDFADLDVSQTGGPDTYYRKPGVWITFLGRATMGPGYLYRIDAYAWGGNKRSLVVTEAVFYAGGSTSRSTAASNLGQ